MSVLETVTYVDICSIDGESKYSGHDITASIVFDHFENEYFAKIEVIGDNSFTSLASLGHNYLAINEDAIHDTLTSMTNCLDNKEEHTVIDFVVNQLALAYIDILPD